MYFCFHCLNVENLRVQYTFQYTLIITQPDRFLPNMVTFMNYKSFDIAIDLLNAGDFKLNILKYITKCFETFILKYYVTLKRKHFYEACALIESINWLLDELEFVRRTASYFQKDTFRETRFPVPVYYCTYLFFFAFFPLNIKINRIIIFN